MKLRRIGFLPVVALLTIILTSAAKVDAFKSLSSNIDVPCAQGVDLTAILIDDTWYTNPDHLASNCDPDPSSTNCPSVDGATACILDFCLSPDQFTCVTADDEFCCAKFIDDVCPDDPVSVQIFCKASE